MKRHEKHCKEEKQGTCHGASQNNGEPQNSRRVHERGGRPGDVDVNKDDAHQVSDEEGKEHDRDEEKLALPEIKSRVQDMEAGDSQEDNKHGHLRERNHRMRVLNSGSKDMTS